MGALETSYEVFFWVNAATFVFYISLSSTILIKMKFNLDRISLIAIFAVFISFLVRFVNWLVFKLQHWGHGDNSQFTSHFLIVDIVATSIFLLNGYFFTFEMKMVHEQVKSKSYEDFIAREKRVRTIRNIFMSLAILVQAISVLITVYYYARPEDNFLSPLYILFICAGALQLAMNGYLFFVTVSYLIFVFNRRRKIIKERGAK
jgi:hypothetical protein